MPFTTYHQDQMGTAVVDSAQPRVAGELDSFTITYTAGTYGIDDSGMIKFSWRTTSDMEKPQFDRPQDRGFTTVEASNGATLECWIDRSNIRPWTNSLIVRVNRGYLRKGDTITVRFGDTRQGSPGSGSRRTPKASSPSRSSWMPLPTYEFAELDNPPGFQLIPGKPAAWRAIVPSRVAPGAPFNLSLVTLDRWGNPTEAGDTGAVTPCHHGRRGQPAGAASAGSQGHGEHHRPRLGCAGGGCLVHRHGCRGQRAVHLEPAAR